MYRDIAITCILLSAGTHMAWYFSSVLIKYLFFYVDFLLCSCVKITGISLDCDNNIIMENIIFSIIFPFK